MPLMTNILQFRTSAKKFISELTDGEFVFVANGVSKAGHFVVVKPDLAIRLFGEDSKTGKLISSMVTDANDIVEARSKHFRGSKE